MPSTVDGKKKQGSEKLGGRKTSRTGVSRLKYKDEKEQMGRDDIRSTGNPHLINILNSQSLCENSFELELSFL